MSYSEDIVPILHKWNSIASETKEVSRHAFPETEEEYLASGGTKTLDSVVTLISMLMNGCFAEWTECDVPFGYTDKPYTTEEILAVLDNIHSYLKDKQSYQNRFIPKSLAELFLNLNKRNEASYKKSTFLQLVDKPLAPKATAYSDVCRKEIPVEIFEMYKNGLFYNLSTKDENLLYSMIYKVKQEYTKLKTDLTLYYKYNQNFKALFGTFRRFAQFHVDLIRDNYGGFDLHPGFLSTTQKVWARLIQTIHERYGIVVNPDEHTKLHLLNKRYIHMIENNIASPEEFDDDFQLKSDKGIVLQFSQHRKAT